MQHLSEAASYQHISLLLALAWQHFSLNQCSSICCLQVGTRKPSDIWKEAGHSWAKYPRLGCLRFYTYKEELQARSKLLLLCLHKPWWQRDPYSRLLRCNLQHKLHPLGRSWWSLYTVSTLMMPVQAMQEPFACVCVCVCACVHVWKCFIQLVCVCVHVCAHMLYSRQAHKFLTGNYQESIQTNLPTSGNAPENLMVLPIFPQYWQLLNCSRCGRKSEVFTFLHVSYVRLVLHTEWTAWHDCNLTQTYIWNGRWARKAAQRLYDQGCIMAWWTCCSLPTPHQ